MIALLFVMIGCGGSPSQQVVAEPVPIGLAECGVCGMVVAEQPAPHGQVMHRDGTHVHLCSLGDLRAYVQAPGPRGEPVGVWVEAMPSLEWIPAQDAYFVAVEREGVMGIPLMSYAERPDVERVYTWKELVSTPFSELPSRRR